MSGHTAQSPAPRSASVGPNGPLPTPTGAPLVNGITGGNVSQQPPAGTGTSGGGGGQLSQTNLNQIVSL
jgi:hypothetical protein